VLVGVWATAGGEEGREEGDGNDDGVGKKGDDDAVKTGGDDDGESGGGSDGCDDDGNV
jgi:hypothetical protein